MKHNLRILTRHDCPACKGSGRTTPPPDYTETSIKLYETVYCPCCQGVGYLEKWLSLDEVLNNGDLHHTSLRLRLP